MKNRINVYVDGKVVGTVPEWPNGTGEATRAQLESGIGPSIRVAVRYGDVARIDADSVAAANKLPGFSPPAA